MNCFQSGRYQQRMEYIQQQKVLKLNLDLDIFHFCYLINKKILLK